MDGLTLRIALLGAGLLLVNALLVSAIVDQQAQRRERQEREADERSLTQELDQIQLDLDDLEHRVDVADRRTGRLEDTVDELTEVETSVP
jgi:hypothetical protein